MNEGLPAALRSVSRSRRVQGAAIVVALVALAGWANPLTNHLGFASALVAALLGSFAGAVVGAGLPALVRARNVRLSGGEIATLAGGFGAALVLLFALLTLAHGALGPVCTPGHGAVFFLVLSAPGAILASLLGALGGAGISRRRWPTVAAIAVVLLSIVASIVRFYRSPAVFMYDPFFGFFPGTLYDETIEIGAAMVTYRLGTLGAIVAAAALLVGAWDPEAARLSHSRLRAHVPALVAAASGLLLSLGVYLAGPALGHRYSSDEVAEGLGGRVDGPRCTVVYARSIDGRAATRMRDDCEVRLRQDEAFFGLPAGGRVTVFLFADARQKQRYMGAADTYVAKPWRREVYLQAAGFPHPVLKHEIAHVVAGGMASGPFYVSMRAGVLPLPGLIEGAAVAAAWEGESDASPHQWSRAMMEAGLLPAMRELTGLGFLLNASSKAYTAAGSFSRWLVQQYGPAKYQRVYRDGDFATAYGRPLAALEDDWRAFLRGVETPERLLVRARTRFHRAPLQARVCPHETAEMLDRAELSLAAGQVVPAREALARVVANDPTESTARAELAEAWARSGQVPRAMELAARAETDLGPAAGAQARLRVADALWRWGSADGARDLYSSVSPELLEEDEARTLEVKRWMLGVDRAAPDAVLVERVRDLLVGRGDRRPDVLAGAVGLVPFAQGNTPQSAFAGYTLGRQLLGHERPEQARLVLDAVAVDALPTERLRAELQRLSAVARYEAGMRAEARGLFDRIAHDPARPQGIRDAAADWVQRIDVESALGD